MSELKPHDYFKATDQGYISREVFQEHVRKNYDKARELNDKTKDLQSQTQLLQGEMRDYHMELDDVIEGNLIQTKVDERVEQKYNDLNNEYNTELNSLTAQLAQTENEITTHVNKPDIHKPIRVFEREPNSGEINNGDLLFIYDNFLDWTPTKWEIGSLQSSNGEPLPATHRVRVKDYIPITPGEYKSFVTGPTNNSLGNEVGTANYLFYTESNSFISTTSWVTNGSNITIPSNTAKMKVLVRLPNDSEVDVNLANDTIKPVFTKVYR